MTAGGDWGILDLPGDPVPGDPVNVRALATFSQHEAEIWQEYAQTLRGMSEQGRAMPMVGDFVAPYRAGLDAHPQAATALQNAHSSAGSALSQYSEQLESAKTQSQAALTQGTQAKENYNQAMQVRDQAVSEMNSLPRVVPPEQYPYVLQQYEMLEAEANQAQAYAEQAEEQWTMARQQAVAAGETAREAELACAQQVSAAAPGAAAARGGGTAGPPPVAGAAATGGSDADTPPPGSEGEGGGFQPGDPVPPPLTGDRLPANAKLGADFVGENDPDNPARAFAPSTVHYMDEAERETRRIFADGEGRLRWASNGVPVNTGAATSLWSGKGKAIFVMDRSGNLYSSLKQERGVLHHSSFLGGRDVVGAGELDVRDGRLFEMTNNSGHYRPTAEMNDVVIETLRERGVIFDPSFKTEDVSR